MTETFEALHKLISDGWSWATGIALFVAIYKIREGRQRKRLDELILRELRTIREGLGLNANGPQPNWNQATIQQLRIYYSYLRREIQLVDQLRRRRRMQAKDINIVSLTIAILGALKIVLEAFNVDIITDDQINSIANAVAAVVTIVGVMVSHSKPKVVTIDDAISNSIERTE